MTDTWKIVPLEPTEEMIDMGACYEKQDLDIVSEGDISHDIYRAMLAAAPEPEQKPVAYAAFSENGNIRIWSQEPGRIDATAAVDGFEVKPLYTHPASEEITALRSLLEQAKKEREELLTHVEELQAKVDIDKDCACSFDRPGDVCDVHSPKLMAAIHRAEAAEKALADARNAAFKEAEEILRKAFQEDSPIPSACAPWISGAIKAIKAKVTP